MAREPFTATERYLYRGGFIAGLGLGTFLGWGLLAKGFVNINTGIMFSDHLALSASKIHG